MPEPPPPTSNGYVARIWKKGDGWWVAEAWYQGERQRVAFKSSRRSARKAARHALEEIMRPEPQVEIVEQFD